MSPATDTAAFLVGFVVAEGCFTTRGPRRFVFSVGLGATDAGMCELLAAFLGVGGIHHFPRRKAHHDDEVTYSVSSLPELVEVVVPFMDAHLPPSFKRDQYEPWRARLLDYWTTTAKRQRPCTIDGCPHPRRAKELCRHHYYTRYRR